MQAIMSHLLAFYKYDQVTHMEKSRSNCPIAYALDIFGDRWSLLIVRDLLLHGKKHYGDFLNSDERMATNILADRLVSLERRGLISKTVDPTDKRRSLYRLTPVGIDLAPVLLEIIVWSAKCDPDTLVSQEFLQRAESDRESLLTEIRQGAEG
jgi:DNA-binding HxlR family transcriptional regulator